MEPELKRCASIQGKDVCLRDVQEDDAEFILRLRLDPKKSRHISTTSNSLADQIAWIKQYHAGKDQCYFIVCDKSDRPIGCLRMYDPIGTSFCWGSWLMEDGLSPFTSLQAVILMYAYGLRLGFDEARISVRHANTSVWQFHERFSNAELLSEDELDRHYRVSKSSMLDMLTRFRHLLPLGWQALKFEASGRAHQ